MNSFTITYTCKYCLDFAPEYIWSKCGKCYNTKTGRLIKQIYKGGSIGYIIRGKFKTISKLRKCLTEIKQDYYCPF